MIIVLSINQQKIVETAKRSGADVVLDQSQSLYNYPRAGEDVNNSTSKRLIDIVNPTPKTVDALMGLNLPSGVNIEIKL